MEGFKPCLAEPDVWMRAAGKVYEYIAVYVDDLALAMLDPSAFIRILVDKHKFQVKGSGELTFHLGANFVCDPDGTLIMSPTKYVTERLVASYECMFGTKPSQTVLSPLDPGDHPELDDSELLDEDGTQRYQSLIGSLQWVFSLGRFDIACAVMTMSSFRAAPCRGHLEHLKRICGYLLKMRHFGIRFSYCRLQ